MTSVKLGVTVMYLAGAREHLVRDLLRRLDQSEATFVRHQRDVKGIGNWRNARAAWSQAGHQGATHHLVLQEDVLPCRDFIAGVKAAIELRPEHAVSPYSGQKVVADAVDAGSSWACVTGGVYGQGLVLPVPWVDEFLRWERWACWPEGHPHWNDQGDDSRLGQWLTETERPVWQMCPTLLEHVGTKLKGERSTLGHSSIQTTSRAFLGSDRSALEIDWTKGLDKPLRGSHPWNMGRMPFKPLAERQPR